MPERKLFSADVFPLPRDNIYLVITPDISYQVMEIIK